MNTQTNQQQPEVQPPAVTTAIAEYSTTAAALAALSEKYKGVVYDLTTSEGMRAALKGRAELRGYRTDLEKTRQKVKVDVLERGRLIDSEAKRIASALSDLEDPIDAQIKIEEERKDREHQEKERAEAERVAKIQARIAAFGADAAEAVGRSSAEISEIIATVNAQVIDESFGEFDVTARTAKARAIATLEQLRYGALAQEEAAERARLARIEEEKRLDTERADLARQREENDRLERERQARIVAENKRIAEERAQAEAQDRARREKVEAEERASKERIATEQKAARDRIEAEQAAARKAREEQAAKDAAAAQKEREAREAQEAAIAKEREQLEAQRREVAKREADLMDARAMLTTFKERFGAVPEFKGVVAAIATYFKRDNPAKAAA